MNNAATQDPSTSEKAGIARRPTRRYSQGGRPIPDSCSVPGSGQMILRNSCTASALPAVEQQWGAEGAGGDVPQMPGRLALNGGLSGLCSRLEALILVPGPLLHKRWKETAPAPRSLQSV